MTLPSLLHLDPDSGIVQRETVPLVRPDSKRPAAAEPLAEFVTVLRAEWERSKRIEAERGRGK